MLCFESMLAKPAEDAGIKVPPSELLDQVEYKDKNKSAIPTKAGKEGKPAWDREDYPHFAVFCTLQLGRAMSGPTEHWENAKVIARFTEEEIRTATIETFLSRGLRYVN